MLARRIDPDVGHDLDAVPLQRHEELFPGLPP